MARRSVLLSEVTEVSRTPEEGFIIETDTLRPIILLMVLQLKLSFQRSRSTGHRYYSKATDEPADRLAKGKAVHQQGAHRCYTCELSY